MRIRNSFFSVLPTLFRAVFQLLMQKHIAWNFGPSGVFVFGQISNIASLANSLALGGAGNGLILFMTKKESKELSCIDIGSIGVLFASGLLIVCIAGFVLLKTDYVIAWDAVTKANANILFGMLILSYLSFSIFTFANSVLVGSSNLRTYCFIGVSAVFLAIILYLILLITSDSYTDIYFAPFIYCLAAVICSLLWRSEWWKVSTSTQFRLEELYKAVGNLFTQSAMSVLSSITTPLTTLYLLYLVSSKLGDVDAGQLYALTKLADVFTIFLGPLIVNRIYPTITNWKHHKYVLHVGIKKSLILFLIMLTVLQVSAFFSDIFFKLLFSSDFFLDEKIVRIYFLGDAFKLLLTCLAYFVISANALRVYILIDVAQKIVLVFLVDSVIASYGLLGYAICYTATVFLTLVCTGLWVFNSSYRSNASS